MRHIFNNERGSERAYTIAGFAIIFLVIFFSWKFGSPFFKNMSLNTYAQELVNYDFHNERPTPNGVRTIHKKLYARIQQKNMPIKEKQIKVDYDLKKYSVVIEYVDQVDLYITKINLDYRIAKQSDNSR